jgi:hypothetical protein
LFGYIKPFKPELKIKEFEQYNAVYCGLCHAIGKRYGLIARLILNYDLTFLAMLKLNNNNCTGFDNKRCIVHPFKKHSCSKPSQDMDLVADIAVIMLYYKLKDNFTDGNILHKILLLFILPCVALIHKKAAKNQSETETLVKNYVLEQHTVEQKKSSSIDEAAHPTAMMMSELAKSCAKNESEKRIYERFGYFLGRWIYITDAQDDIKADTKHKNYNPFVVSYEIKVDTELKAIHEKAKMLLNSCIYEMTAAYELLPKGCYDSIISNIIYLGLVEQERLINEGKKEKQI